MHQDNVAWNPYSLAWIIILSKEIVSALDELSIIIAQKTIKIRKFKWFIEIKALYKVAFGLTDNLKILLSFHPLYAYFLAETMAGINDTHHKIQLFRRRGKLTHQSAIQLDKLGRVLQ